MDAAAGNWRKKHPPPDTLYFGGGTRHCWVPAQASFDRGCQFLPGAEITLEANPMLSHRRRCGASGQQA